MKKLLLLLLSSTILSGCVTTYEFVSPVDQQALAAPPADKAQVVFLRPSGGFPMGDFMAIVFDNTEGNNDMIGVTAKHTKFAINFEPGTHQLLATEGIKGHIMAMNVEAGERYYVVVRPIYGNGFQLRPLKASNDDEFSLQTEELDDWLAKTEIVAIHPQAYEWYARFEENVDKLKAKALEDWAEKDDSQRALLTLEPADAAPK